jgi:hypothetical protein
MMLSMLADVDGRIAALDREIAQRARQDEAARRLMTIPGIGPITATAMLALAPAPEAFARGRDFAAWLELVPRQHSSGGKERLRTDRIVAGPHAGAQAAHAGDGGAGQQDGTHRLGGACQGSADAQHRWKALSALTLVWISLDPAALSYLRWWMQG